MLSAAVYTYYELISLSLLHHLLIVTKQFNSVYVLGKNLHFYYKLAITKNQEDRFMLFSGNWHVVSVSMTAVDVPREILSEILSLILVLIYVVKGIVG